MADVFPNVAMVFVGKTYNTGQYKRFPSNLLNLLHIMSFGFHGAFVFVKMLYTFKDFPFALAGSLFFLRDGRFLKSLENSAVYVRSFPVFRSYVHDGIRFA